MIRNCDQSIGWIKIIFQPSVIDACPDVIIDAAAAMPGQTELICAGDRQSGWIADCSSSAASPGTGVNSSEHPAEQLTNPVAMFNLWKPGSSKCFH
ncbi:hypothetical protein SynMITS9220_01900 [Synechococcus sp. MIT S9220]|nr:hypothetical protein SynMITS9220_01900 [Synechococcus sp. MIT S9220]